MSENERFNDDPQLTAYALGELEGDERATVEARVRSDAAARAAVEEIRVAAARLERALAEETEREEKREAAKAGDPYRQGKRGHALRFPQVYYVIGGLAAACFAVVVALQEPEAPVKERERKVYREVAVDSIMVAMPEADAASRGEEQSRESKPFPQSGDVFAVEMPAVDASSAGLVEANREKAMAVLTAKRTAEDFYNSLTIGGGATFGAAPAESASMLAKGHGEQRAEDAAPAVVSTAFKAGVLKRGSVAVRLRNGGGQGAAMMLKATAEAYAYRAESGFVSARENPLSTFGADVDTASYANVRRFIERGEEPPVEAVRIEEMVNYFPYRYEAPGDEGAALAANIEVAEAPWAAGHRLVRIGLKGREVTAAARGAANLVFLLDVSGSMEAENKLPLVKESMRLLLKRLRADDRVAIVTYANGSSLALGATPVAKEREILAAIDGLAAGGSTNGGMGLQLAYEVARANFVEGGINRVVLCTDGDFNVGVTSEGELVRLIEEKAKMGVFLTVLGFGMGNLKDSVLQQIANRGNGSYGYVDTRREAEKLLVEQATGTLLTIAKDVKLQVEFNPARVAAYRLIGYERRALAKEDFADDKTDAGEIGAGHAVTALYEVVPAGANHGPMVGEVEALRYAPARVVVDVPREVADELLTVKVRYKAPAGTESRRLEFPVKDGGAGFAGASGDFKFAAAVAAFGMVLRDSEHKGTTDLAAVEAWAEAGLGYDPGGYRAEFVELVRAVRRGRGEDSSSKIQAPENAERPISRAALPGGKSGRAS